MKRMYSFAALLTAGCLASAAILAVPQEAKATVVTEEILESGSPAGSISFPAFTGTGTAGVDFSLNGFTQSDITSLSWTVDPSNLHVLALDLQALQGDNPCPDGTTDCSNSTLTLTTSDVELRHTSCSFSGDLGACLSAARVIPVTFRPVPEPSTLVLTVSGLLGLGLIRRR